MAGLRSEHDFTILNNPFISFFNNYLAIIALAFILACGFLLVFLSCALYKSWLPLLVVATYLLAPLPNAICKRYANNDDLSDDSYSSGVLDLGYFLTGMLILSGLGLPFVLSHAEILSVPAVIMSALGGLIVYSTIIVYTHYFAHEGDEF
ncbi:uncharacterized protein VTP21DRAFT_10476 [Calcarisporiella thermophila]|uniref:uncharacterized protein n=1 Tax=Calcarisporiella thermophila TaxID=911321 RepID=UPI003743D455